MKHKIAIYIIGGLLLGSCSGRKSESKMPEIDTIPQMVMQIQKCSRLYATEYKVHKIITHTDQKKLTGSLLSKAFSFDVPMSDRKIAIPMDATLKAYVDFGQFTAQNVRKRGQKIEIILPDPRIVITSTKIDHAAIKKYVNLVRSDFTDDELGAYEKAARQEIEKDIPQMGILENARGSAARILIPLMEQMGYERNNVVITFRKEFTLADLPQLIDKSTTENGKAAE